MKDPITIEKSALVELINSAFNKGWQAAAQTLVALEYTAKFDTDKLNELVGLEDKP